MPSVQVDYNPKAFDLLDELPITVRRKSARKATRSAAAVVAREARRRAPSSTRTGTRDKWSKKTKAKRQGTRSLKQQIRARNVKDRDDPTAIVMSLNAAPVEFGHKMVLWGKKTGRKVKPRPFVRPAIDATIGEQQRILTETLKREIEEEVGNYTR